MTLLRHKVLSPVLAVLMLAVGMLAGLSSCSAVYDDLDACPRGVEMRFVFDYNLEFANAFPSQVDCLSVYVFDSEGNLVERRTETSGVLADEDWRMTFDLPAGDYQVVAYGGMDCEQSSFAHLKNADGIKRIEDLEVLVNEGHLGDEQTAPTAPLHDHFHAWKQFTVNEGTDYDRIKVEMMRNTNHLRLVLQHIDGTPVDHQDFKFEVIDDNVRFDHANNVLPHRTINYQPWARGNAFAGVHGYTGESDTKADEGMPVQVAYAELSLSRLMHRSAFTWTKSDGKPAQGPRLRITSTKDGHTVADLPLNNYLLLMKSDYFRDMDAQEYLDRSYRHNLVFFLDSDKEYWVTLHIVVGDWTVRIDNAEF